MILEKVYDELYGMIEDLKKKINAAEKSDVTITPALESGTKIADFEIDGNDGSIYAPQDLSEPSGVGEAVSIQPGSNYTTPTDGYVFAVISGGDTNGYVYVDIRLANTSCGNIYISKASTEYAQAQTTYVKKGMVIANDNGSLRAIKFFPFTYGTTRTKTTKKK